jgi:hypothetical protein
MRLELEAEPKTNDLLWRKALDEEGWLRGVDLNHRPLGYEPNRIEDSSAFQRLDAAGNDTKSLERQESRVIGPQSDHA